MSLPAPMLAKLQQIPPGSTHVGLAQVQGVGVTVIVNTLSGPFVAVPGTKRWEPMELGQKSQIEKQLMNGKG